jgi:hypothetical protein
MPTTDPALALTAPATSLMLSMDRVGGRTNGVAIATQSELNESDAALQPWPEPSDSDTQERKEKYKPHIRKSGRRNRSHILQNFSSGKRGTA